MMLTPKCAKCKQQKPIIPDSIIPAMVGFEMEDGKIINICSDCLAKLGEMKDGETDNFFEGLGEENE